ncbi:ABC transporter ATP-binding protein [Amycolatopsis japonica]|uniref:ABC transporter ATP-binding protein n=1 Tax=Amycolatopsis japonica TaxID=208439 RepID=UPI00366B5414
MKTDTDDSPRGQILQVRDLHAGYGGVEVVRGVSFDVAPGQVVALLGPNGAGKTTTLSTIAGVLPPLRGEMLVDGRKLARKAHLVVRSGISLVPEDRGLFSQLSVADNLKLVRRRKVDRDGPVLSQFPALRKLWRRRVGLLSGGEQQMVALASALLRAPRLLLIDEMSLGLAPQVVARLLAVVRELADREGIAVLLVEQHASLVLDIADHALVLRRGQIALSGSAEEVRAQPELLESSYLAAADQIVTSG